MRIGRLVTVASAALMSVAACGVGDADDGATPDDRSAGSAATTVVASSVAPPTTATVLTSIPYCPTQREDVHWNPGDPVPEADWTQDDLDAALDRLMARVEAIGDTYLTGVSPSGREMVDNRVQIDLSDASQAALFAEGIGLEPPYEIYCITPEDVGSENADG